MERLRTAVISQVRSDPFLGSKPAALVQIFKKASCTTSSARPGSPSTRMATAYERPAYRSYSSKSASWLPAARTTASSASARPSVAIGSHDLERVSGRVAAARPAGGQLTDRGLLRGRDRPLFFLDEPGGPVRILSPAVAGRVERHGHELDPGQAGELADLLVEGEQLFLSLLIIKQVQGERVNLLLRLHSLADWYPDPVEHPAVDPLRLLVVGEPFLGRVEVEGEMPPLILDDPPEQVPQHGVPRLADEGSIPGQRRKLVDRADGQIHRREVFEQPRTHHRRHEADAVRNAKVGAHVGDPVLRVELDSIQVEELPDVLAVPQLLVVPAGEEGGEDGVHAGARHQQVREVERNVILDVHHVVEAEKVSTGQPAGDRKSVV